MGGNESFNDWYELTKETTGGSFIGGLFFRWLEGPCEYPGTCNVFGTLSGIFGLIFLIGLISLIILFIVKKYKGQQ